MRVSLKKEIIMQNNTLRPPTVGIGPFQNKLLGAAHFIHFTVADVLPEIDKIGRDTVTVNSGLEVKISTIRMIDLYETVIFHGKLHGITRHYDSVDDAKKGHQDALMSVRKAEWS